MTVKRIWAVDPDLSILKEMANGNMLENLGIEITKVGDDFLEARMPVDHRTIQPVGILHGGATATLAETLGSMASTLVIADQPGKQAVGLELNISHLSAMQQGYVTGRAVPVRLGRKVHVWDIRIRNEEGKPVSIGRLTVMIISNGTG